MNNMLICIILPDLRGGGAERVVVNLANGFIKRGYLVDMVLLNAEGEFLDDLLPEVRVVNLKAARMRSGLIPLVLYLKSVPGAVVLSCMWPITIISLVARVLARSCARVVVAEHTTWSRSEQLSRRSMKWLIRTSMHRIFPLADAVVAVSFGAADDLARFASLERKAITVIYNPVVGDVLPVGDDIFPVKIRDWSIGSHRRIVAVGTLKEIKDYPTLLNAFALLCKRMDVRLLILGEGECRAALEAQIRFLDVGDRVFMPGFVKDVSPYYRHAHLHVLSSIGEGLPTVVIEALAAGTPVVSTDCPSGPREILADGKYGGLVPVGDVPALADAMEASLHATHDRAALQMRAQDFSIDKAVDRYLELLVLGTASGGQI